MSEKKKVVVVGIAGIGMAHVCAAGRLGYEVVGLVDINPTLLMQATERWVNRFDGLEEETAVQDGCTYYVGTASLPHRTDLPEADLVIVCTPPHIVGEVLADLAAAWPRATIMLEKPVWPSPTFLAPWGHRLTMSSEYAFLTNLGPALREHSTITICSTRPTMTTDWGYRLFMTHDYMPHLGGMLWHHLGDPGGRYGWEDFRNSYDQFSGRLHWGERYYDVVAVRGEGVPYGWQVGPTKLHWELELFDRQMREPTPGVPFAGFLKINSLMRGKPLVSPNGLTAELMRRI